MDISFGIQDWAGWMPGVTSAQEWQEWAKQGSLSDGHIPDVASPDVSAIPPMLRRRLSPMGRAAVSVMMPLYEQYGPMPIVYMSRHGEVARTLDMLQALSIDEPLSPTAFSLSVHNALSGLFSIQQQAQGAITAIAAGADDLAPALLEARAQINDSTPYILCVFCDTPLPDFYRCQLPPDFLYASAFVINAQETFSLQFKQQQGLDQESAQLPQALRFLRFLLQKQESTLQGQRWRISKRADSSC